jgi:hypothetical protein
MGGHHSRQSAVESSQLITKASVSATESCISVTSDSQSISVGGSGDTVSGNVQKSTISVSSSCMAKIKQSGDFSSKLSDAISQQLSDHEVALTQWLSPGGDDQKSAILDTITTNVTFSDVETCVNKLTGSQAINVSGDDDTVTDNIQDQSLTEVADCLLGGSQSSSTVNDVTNTTNQHSKYVSENPFAFVTDAIDDATKSVAAIIAIMFIVIIILVLMYKVIKHAGKKSATTSVVAEPTSVADTSSSVVDTSSSVVDTSNT